ncbi:MAG: serine/threonine-protein kinase [Acidobacteria bacterium]|nr:serine/threonine-protein kinase [Acidobacteriota bacterium]
MIGQSIAHYRITSKLGEGGMGIVYRASDTKLDRDVAIKVLPPEVANEPDRLARFEREAKTLAALNHPNIAAVYGVESAALIMELVEGPTLADRLNSEKIPQDEAISIAVQIAEALEAAHEKGIVHRDLKPANIKLTPSHQVKLLDFGLAKAMETTKAIPGDPVNSPTIVAASMPGVIMGTAGYMSPEQAKGHPVDRRADIWSFGVVLHEMLTGQRLFDAGTIAESIAEVLKRDIDLNTLPTTTPPHIKSLLNRCLDRNPKTRLRDIGEARIQLTTPPSTTTQPTKPAPKWPYAVIAALAIAIPAAWLLKPTPRPAAQYLEIVPPLGVSMGPVGWGQLAVSPNGEAIVYAARDRDGKDHIYLRSFTEGTTVIVPGSDGAGRPFWSPDSRHIGFFAAGKLKRVEPATGKVLDLAETAASLGAWGADTILISSSPLQKVPAAGGKPESALPPKAPWAPGSGAPHFFPDGQTFLHNLTLRPRSVIIRTLDFTREQTILRGEAANAGATYSPNPAGGGWLLYKKGPDNLYARSFDYKSGKFSGEETMLAQDVPGGPSWSNSHTGILAYRSSRLSGEDRTLTWVHRDGSPGKTIAGPANVYIPRISPDEQSVAYSYSQSSGSAIYEFQSDAGASTRIASKGGASYPAWTSDGGSILYSSGENSTELIEHPVRTGGVPHTIAKTDGNSNYRATGVSPDGKWIACARMANAAAHTVFIHRESGRAIPLDTDQDPYSTHATFSPDGRRFVYSRMGNSGYEVFVRTVPKELGGPASPMEWQVSTNGGKQPKWSADGKEIFFVANDGKMMATAVQSTPDTFRVGATTALFQTTLGLRLGYQREYDVTHDGKRFILPLPPSGPHQEAPITVILNWPSLLNRK